MGKVNFLLSNIKGTYWTDWNSDIDCSGAYYPAADYEALEAKLTRLVEAASWALNSIRGRTHSYSNVEYISNIKELKSAIEAAKVKS